MELLKIENGIAKYWNDGDYHDIKEIDSFKELMDLDISYQKYVEGGYDYE